MELNPDGTIDTEYGKLRRPRIGEVWDFEDRAAASARSFQTTAQAMADRLSGPESVDQETLDEASDLRRKGFIYHFEPFYRKVFGTLGATLPDDIGEWPGEFLDNELPKRLLDHWRMNPKASGQTPPG